MSVRLKMIRQQRIGVIVLICLIFLVELLIHRDIFSDNKIEIEELPVKINKEIVVHDSRTKIQNVLQNFNPNIYTSTDWQKIGFSQKQAEVILSYKKLIGGKFTSKEQIKKCFVISEEKYNEIAPFIQLSKGEVVEKIIINERKAVVGEKELNTVSFSELNSLIDNKEVSGRIVNFRKGLGGFVSKDQLKDVYGITNEMIVDISDYFILDITKVSKINLEKATERELQNHIYLRRYKNKIIEAQKKGEYPLRVIPKSDAKYDLILMYLEK